MIKSSDQSIWIREPDGTLNVFEVDTVHSQLYAAFARTGRSEGYLAEDLALALEFILLSTERESRIFLRSEIDGALGRMLADAGYPEVLAAWRERSSAAIELTVTARPAPLSELIANHLAVEGPALERLARRVADAAFKLGMTELRPPLAVELARQYERDDIPRELPVPASVFAPIDAPGVLATEAAIMPGLSMATREYFTAGAFELTPVSRYFPSFRVRVRLMALAGFRRWTPPVTEMMVCGDFVEAGRRLAELRQAVREAVGELPFYLNVPDLPAFTTEVMESEWPQGRKSALELVRYLFDGLGEKPFKLRIG